MKPEKESSCLQGESGEITKQDAIYAGIITMMIIIVSGLFGLKILGAI